MPGWLLGPQAFADFIAEGDNEVVAWASDLNDPVYVTETTWAYVRSQVHTMTDVRQRASYLRALDSRVPAEFGPRLLRIDRAHLVAWSEVRHSRLRSSGQPVPLPESFDVAVCIVEKLGYVTDLDDLGAIMDEPTVNPWAS